MQFPYRLNLDKKNYISRQLLQVSNWHRLLSSKTSSARVKVSKRQKKMFILPNSLFFYNMQRKMYAINPKQGLESGYSTIGYVDTII